MLIIPWRFLSLRAPLCICSICAISPSAAQKGNVCHCLAISIFGLKERGPHPKQSASQITQASKLGILLTNHSVFITHCYVGHTHTQIYALTHTHSNFDPVLIWILGWQILCKSVNTSPYTERAPLFIMGSFPLGLCGLGRETRVPQIILSLL